MVQETRTIHYTWEETELEMDRAKRPSIHPLNKPFLWVVSYHYFARTPIYDMWARNNRDTGAWEMLCKHVKKNDGEEEIEGEEEEEPDRQIWNSSCMLSDMWQGFGERNEWGRGVPEEERRDYSREEEESTEEKLGRILKMKGGVNLRKRRQKASTVGTLRRNWLWLLSSSGQERLWQSAKILCVI